MDLPPDTGEKPLKSFVMLDLSSLAERTPCLQPHAMPEYLPQEERPRTILRWFSEKY